MKQKIISILFIMLLLTAVAAGLPGKISAWDDCPKGLVNDEYPGSCPRYVDTDGNGICDRSEPAPEDRPEHKDSNQPVTENQTEDSIVLSSNTEIKNTSYIGLAAVLSILIPLAVLIAYASIYKINRDKRL